MMTIVSLLPCGCEADAPGVIGPRRIHFAATACPNRHSVGQIFSGGVVAAPSDLLDLPPLDDDLPPLD